mmetsp:Transcript_6757/g.17257  ORF Transcript_6757/g.17257 Transcript_6757/m.17257 type:complete len:267 (+) Transcript_6757:1228-2028(+)
MMSLGWSFRCRISRSWLMRLLPMYSSMRHTSEAMPARLSTSLSSTLSCVSCVSVSRFSSRWILLRPSSSFFSMRQRDSPSTCMMRLSSTLSSSSTLHWSSPSSRVSSLSMKDARRRLVSRSRFCRRRTLLCSTTSSSTCRHHESSLAPWATAEMPPMVVLVLRRLKEFSLITWTVSVEVLSLAASRSSRVTSSPSRLVMLERRRSRRVRYVLWLQMGLFDRSTVSRLGTYFFRTLTSSSRYSRLLFSSRDLSAASPLRPSMRRMEL